MKLTKTSAKQESEGAAAFKKLPDSAKQFAQKVAKKIGGQKPSGRRPG